MGIYQMVDPFLQLAHSQLAVQNLAHVAFREVLAGGSHTDELSFAQAVPQPEEMCNSEQEGRTIKMRPVTVPLVAF